MGAFWHPFADMSVVDGREFVVDSGDGVYVVDEAGRRYLDGTASLWYCNAGYGRTAITAAVAAQMNRLAAFHTFGDFANRPALELCDRLSALAPVHGSKVFLTSGGSDSVDSAAKLARRYFAEIGEPERTVFITREWGYHGMHAYGTSLAGIAANREGHGPLVEQVVQVQWDSIPDLEDAVERVGPDRIAGLVCEPVIGAGGVRIAPEGYLKDARSLMRDIGALFIADEVVTAFGRLGAWFASTRFSLEPDLITFAKGVTSGYAPLGGVIVAPAVAAPFWTGPPGVMWRHGYTYSGHPSACAAALANLDILDDEGLLTRGLDLEDDLAGALEPLLDHPLVSSLRAGTGALAAVQIDPLALEEDPRLAARAAAASREAGVITRALSGGGLQASPALIITPGQLEELAAGLRAGLDACL